MQQQIHQINTGAPLLGLTTSNVIAAPHFSKFGVESSYPFTQCPNQVHHQAPSTMAVHQQLSYQAFGGFTSLSAKRTPHKSTSPVVEDLLLDNNVSSVLAVKPKPATPFATSNSMTRIPMIVTTPPDESNEAVFLSPSDLISGPSPPSMQATPGLPTKSVISVKPCQAMLHKSRLEGRRGKFQLQDKRNQRGSDRKAFLLSDILTNLPYTTGVKNKSLQSSIRNQDTHMRDARVKFGDLTPPARVDMASQEGDSGPVRELEQARSRGGGQCQAKLAPASSRRMTRLQRKANLLKRRQTSGSQSLSSPSQGISSASVRSRRFGQVSSHHHKGGSTYSDGQSQLVQVKKGLKRVVRVPSKTANQISKARRNQVKYQQNRQRHLEVVPFSAQGPEVTHAPNLIGAQTIGDYQVAAFETQMEACAGSDGLWKMEKEHIYSQNQIVEGPAHLSISPDQQQTLLAPFNGMAAGSLQPLRSQNRTPPSRQPMLSNLSNNGGLQNEPQLASMNLVNEEHGGREVSSRNASSSGERELFAIFSGLRVVSMANKNKQNETNRLGASSTQEEEVSLPIERPYRWIPAHVLNLKQGFTTNSSGQQASQGARMSSV